MKSLFLLRSSVGLGCLLAGGMLVGCGGESSSSRAADVAAGGAGGSTGGASVGGAAGTGTNSTGSGGSTGGTSTSTSGGYGQYVQMARSLGLLNGPAPAFCAPACEKLSATDCTGTTAADQCVAECQLVTEVIPSCTSLMKDYYECMGTAPQSAFSCDAEGDPAVDPARCAEPTEAAISTCGQDGAPQECVDYCANVAAVGCTETEAACVTQCAAMTRMIPTCAATMLASSACQADAPVAEFTCDPEDGSPTYGGQSCAAQEQATGTCVLIAILASSGAGG